MSEFTVRHEIQTREGHKPFKRFLISRRRRNGSAGVWAMSPTALRALAEQIREALEEHEEGAYAGHRRPGPTTHASTR